jgi:hypothetical protein
MKKLRTFIPALHIRVMEASFSPTRNPQKLFIKKGLMQNVIFLAVFFRPVYEIPEIISFSKTTTISGSFFIGRPLRISLSLLSFTFSHF